MDADAESREDTSMEPESHSDAFPFSTENPSGVPGITEIEPSVIAAIAGHVAQSVEGVDRLGGSGGIVRTVADTIPLQVLRHGCRDRCRGRPEGSHSGHRPDRDIRLQRPEGGPEGFGKRSRKSYLTWSA